MNNNDPIESFYNEIHDNISTYPSDLIFNDLSSKWLEHAFRKKYMYNFSCLGRPIIQTPIDIIAIQELIWSIKPDLVIETGIAHGGSLILSASMLGLIDYCEAVENGEVLDPYSSKRRVLGIDIDIRKHNYDAIKSHPLSHKIEMIQGSSIAPETVSKVHAFARQYSKIMVFLDSNHTHDHVLSELESYACLTSLSSYCIVFDTIVEDLPDNLFPDRPWGKGNNPKTAVWEYLKKLKREEIKAADGNFLRFEIDREIENKLLITVAPDGFLKRI